APLSFACFAADHRHLHPFPTRRSSDLEGHAGAGQLPLDRRAIRVAAQLDAFGKRALERLAHVGEARARVLRPVVTAARAQPGERAAPDGLVRDRGRSDRGRADEVAEAFARLPADLDVGADAYRS